MRPLEVRLSSWQLRRLRELRRSRAGRPARRAMCLLASANGQPALAVARMTGLSRDAITDIRRRWRERGLASLVDRPRSGRPRHITKRYRRLLCQALGKGPLALGYVFTIWSIARLGRYLARKTGISLSRQHLRLLVHREGFVVGRPRRSLKGKRKESEFRRAQRELNTLKRGVLRQSAATSSGSPTPVSSVSILTSCDAG